MWTAYILLVAKITQTSIDHVISNLRHCSSTILSKHITSTLTAVKYHVMKYSETAFSNSNVIYFWSIKNSPEVIEKLRLRSFQSSNFRSTFLLYTPQCHVILSKQKFCLWSTDISTESQNLISLLHLKLNCGFKYAKPCMINRIWDLKQL